MISWHEVPNLEEKLQKDPSDVATRLLLLNYHLRENNDEVLDHIGWLIKNQPETDFKHYNIWVGVKHIDAVEAAWSQAIEKAPNNLTILRNAISCCSVLTRSTTKRWLEHGNQIDPSNEEWPRQLSFQYYLDTIEKTDEEAKPNASKSIELGKEALERYKKSPREGEFSVRAECERHAELCLRFNLLDDAQYFGEYLVEHGNSRQKISGGNATSLLWHVTDVHQGHSILGRVALRRNDSEQVLYQLAQMPLHVSIDFRPDLEFAQELLDSGKTESVCGYLEDCKQNFKTVLDLMLEEGPFYMAVLQDHDMPIDGPDYLLENLRNTIARIDQWQTAIRGGQKIKLPERF